MASNRRTLADAIGSPALRPAPRAGRGGCVGAAVIGLGAPACGAGLVAGGGGCVGAAVIGLGAPACWTGLVAEICVIPPAYGRDMLLPTTCPACRRPGPAPCPACVAAMHSSPPVALPMGLSACRALLVYEGPARELVARLKYRNARSAVTWLVEGLASLVQGQDMPVAVGWAPTTAVRRRARGFDQAEVLARRLAAHLGLACPALLTRLPGPPQTGRSHAERRAGPLFLVRPRPARHLRVGALLLVDDVITTGATMSAAGTALQQAGLGPVIGLAAAHTAPPSWSRRQSAGRPDRPGSPGTRLIYDPVPRSRPGGR